LATTDQEKYLVPVANAPISLSIKDRNTENEIEIHNVTNCGIEKTVNENVT